MSISLGSSAISTAKLGSSQVSSIYLGSNLVYTNDVPQEPGYTYYEVMSVSDVSMPNWTVRFLNDITASGNAVVGQTMYCANAQFSSASFGGRQQAPPSSVPGVAFGLVGWLVGFSSGGLFTDEYTTTDCVYSIHSTCATVYGGSGFSTTYANYGLRGQTRLLTYTAENFSSWGNQPYPNKCSTYQLSGNDHQWVDCVDGTPYTSSADETICTRYPISVTSAGGNVTITNFYSSSCGTY